MHVSRMLIALSLAGALALALVGPAAAELVYQLDVTGFPSNNAIPSNRQQALTFTVKIHPNAPSSRQDTSANGRVCLRPTADWEWVGSSPALDTLPNRTATRSATGTIKAKGTWTTAHTAIFDAALGACPDNQDSDQSNEVSKSLTVAAGGTTTTAVLKVAPLVYIPKPGTPGLIGGYGWSRPITVINAGTAVHNRLGSAEDTIEGNTLKDIVTRPDVKVRADNAPCTQCHGWAAGSTRTSFCGRVEAFVARSDKPQILKNIFSRWKFSAWNNQACPE